MEISDRVRRSKKAMAKMSELQALNATLTWKNATLKMENNRLKALNATLTVENETLKMEKGESLSPEPETGEGNPAIEIAAGDTFRNENLRGVKGKLIRMLLRM
jgi:hypothetical protein